MEETEHERGDRERRRGAEFADEHAEQDATHDDFFPEGTTEAEEESGEETSSDGDVGYLVGTYREEQQNGDGHDARADDSAVREFTHRALSFEFMDRSACDSRRHEPHDEDGRRDLEHHADGLTWPRRGERVLPGLRALEPVGDPHLRDPGDGGGQKAERDANRKLNPRSISQ